MKNLLTLGSIFRNTSLAMACMFFTPAVAGSPIGIISTDTNVSRRASSNRPTSFSLNNFCLDSMENAWCIYDENTILRVNHVTQVRILLTMPFGSTPKGICFGPDGNLWIYASGTGTIECMNTATGNIIASIVLDDELDGLVSYNGAIWFREAYSQRVLSINVLNPSVVASQD